MDALLLFHGAPLPAGLGETWLEWAGRGSARAPARARALPPQSKPVDRGNRPAIGA
jgi:hypothetical protein